MNLEIKLNASGSWLWAIVVCLAPLWSVPAMAQQLGTSQGTAGTSSRAQLTQAQAQYDEAKAKAVTAAQNLINANTPQNLRTSLQPPAMPFRRGGTCWRAASAAPPSLLQRKPPRTTCQARSVRPRTGCFGTSSMTAGISNAPPWGWKVAPSYPSCLGRARRNQGNSHAWPGPNRLAPHVR